MKIIDKKNNIVYIQGKDIKLLIEIKNMIPKQFPFVLNWTNIDDDEQFICFNDKKLINFLIKKDWIASYSLDNALVKQRLIQCFKELLLLVNNSINQYDNPFTELEETTCKKIIEHKLNCLIGIYTINNGKAKSPIPKELVEIVSKEEKVVEPCDKEEIDFVKKIKKRFKTNKS